MAPKRHRPQKRACDVCYRRKIQCSFSNSEGPCEWCNHRSLECTFNRERPRKRQRSSIKTSDVQDLFRRIDQLEGALSQAETPSTVQNVANSDDPTISTSSNAPSQSPTHSSDNSTKGYPGEITVSAHQLGPNWFFNGIPISSEAGYQWISTRTGQTASSADFSIPIKDSSYFSFPSLLSNFSQEVYELPTTKDTTREMLNAFFRSSSRLVFPVLDEFLFETTMETAYEPLDRMRLSTQIPARACILSALSIAPRRFVDANMCAAKAHALLMHIAGDNSLATLQTTLILELQSVFGADWQGAALFHSIASRIVCSSKGHIYHPAKELGIEISRLDRENRHIRMLFWLSYMLDKDISLRTGNPPVLTDFYCDLSPPDISVEHHTYLQQPGLEGYFGDDRTNEHSTSCYPEENISLSRLKEKVFRLLFSAQALKDNDNQLLLNIRKLDNEIERWRLSIPVDFRPALLVSQNTSPTISNESIPHLIRRMSLQLDYHHLMTVIHTTVRKCTAETGDRSQDLHEVAHSSFDLSLVASRSTFWCLRYLVDKIPEEVFRFIPFYSTTAAMSLFLDIVMHPLFAQAQLDLELLISAANLIRGIPSHKLTKNEIDRIQETSNFVMRLVWLGSSAVAKAKRKEG